MFKWMRRKLEGWLRGDNAAIRSFTGDFMQNKAVIQLVQGRVSAITDGTTTVTEYAGLQNYDSLLVLVNVTAAGTATGQVNLYIQDTWDGGTSWDDMAASTNISLGTTTGTQRFVIQGRIATSITQGTAVSNAALTAGTVRSGPFGDRIRLVEKVASTSGTPVGCTYSVTVIPCRSENN